MTDETLPPDLWQETRRAAEAWGRHAASSRGDGPGPAGTGQVLALPELDEPRLAWAVLRREEEKLLLVAADVNPLVGSGDVAATAATGPVASPLTLRCRFAVWVSERESGPAALLGILPLEELARADARWQAVTEGRPAGTFSEQETEEDPEYQDWIEDVVRPAAGKLEARAGTAAPTSLPATPLPTRSRSERPPPPRGAWMRWAAVLAFVLLGAGSGFLWWRQGQEIAGLRAAMEAEEAAHRQALAELEARRRNLETRYREQIQKAGQDRARLESEHQARLRDLETRIEKLRQATEIRNPVLASFDLPGTLRGSIRVTVGPEASHVVLLIPVNDPAGAELEIEILEQSSGQRIWLQKGLRPYIVGEVRLGIPTALLPPGDYRLILSRRDNGKLLKVREQGITIEEEPRRRPPRF
ncbi:MAG TPA: hypothetical protein VF789_09290 [Thermoanaerobaculia bacterium]